MWKVKQFLLKKRDIRRAFNMGLTTLERKNMSRGTGVKFLEFD